MNDDALAPTRRSVALVCGEPRLRRILRLSLEGGGYLVLDYADNTCARAGPEPVAVVIDLDSLYRCPRAAARIGARGALDRLPALFVSIYPAVPGDELWQGPTDYLQPPFAADELLRRLERLLPASERASAG